MSEIKRSLVNELHKPIRYNFPRRKVIVKGFNDLFQVDLIDMQKYSRFNKGNKYLLTIIDCFTKKAWAVPIKSKSGPDVAAAMGTVLASLDNPPKYIAHDAGGEFINPSFSRLMKQYNITEYNIYSDTKAQTVERFNRTLKTLMWKEFNFRGSYDYLAFLDSLLLKYNSTPHRSTGGVAPNKVDQSNRYDVMRAIYKLPKMRGGKRGKRIRRVRRKLSSLEKKLKLKTLVRLSKKRTVFDKGYLPSYTTELFRISTIQPTQPRTYLLEDLDGNKITGSFYSYELQPTKHPKEYLVEKILRRQNGRVLVKWLGFDQPTWEPESNMLD